MNAKRLLNWITTCFREALTRSIQQGGVGWLKADCIRNAKMAIALLERFSIPAREISVRLFIANPTLTAYLQKHKKTVGDLSYEETKAITSAHILMMGRRKNAPTLEHGIWHGHLPVIVQEKYLLDMTLDAARETFSDMILPPMVLELTKEAIQKIDECYAFVVSCNQCQLLYQVDPENQEYKKTEAWTVWSPFHESIIDQSEAAVRKVL